MARSGLAGRLYRGEAGLNIIGRRKMWFAIAGTLVLLAILSFAVQRFSLGIEFAGGNSFQVPASVGTLEQTEEAMEDALAGLEREEPARVVSAQRIGGAESSYELRTSELEAEQSTEVQRVLAERFGIQQEQVSANRVSAAWGGQVTQRAVLGLVVFLILVTIYLVLRFEARMAFAAVTSLVMNLVLTAGIYSLVGFEVTPSTIIGFLTILGFSLYDVVVVFDKIQENTRGITGNSSQTYAEAANLAVNQTLMRSINTSVVALLPVGGLLFIGAGLLGAGTLKDLGLVLFVGMGTAFFASIFLATPLMVTFKEQEPRIKSHTQRVLARRASGGRDTASSRRGGRAAAEQSAGEKPAEAAATDVEPAEDERAALAGTTPKVGARPAGKRSGGARGGRPGAGGSRPGGGKRR